MEEDKYSEEEQATGQKIDEQSEQQVSKRITDDFVIRFALAMSAHLKEEREKKEQHKKEMKKRKERIAASILAGCPDLYKQQLLNKYEIQIAISRAIVVADMLIQKIDENE